MAVRAAVAGLVISLTSADPQIQNGWRLLFDLEIDRARRRRQPAHDLRLSARLVDHLPPAPARSPERKIRARPGAGGAVRFYETVSGGALHLARPAQIHFDFEANSAEILLTRSVVDSGNLEDITMTALAPFLRRRGVYMAHAFAVANGGAALLCGPSGSGKTTTGLFLVDRGRKFLANDVTLLQRKQNAINALPSPGAINIDPASLALLPAYHINPFDGYALTSAGKRILPRAALLQADQLGTTAAVRSIIFPSLSSGEKGEQAPLSAAIGLARLIEDSVDQWDIPTYEPHIDFLTRLSRQALFYTLSIPRTTQPLQPQLFSLVDSL